MSDYYRNLSLIMSKVMGDIGVSKESVMKRRRNAMFIEKQQSIINKILTPRDETNVYVFGSQTEGSTTEGLQSDHDTLETKDTYELIQDLESWIPNKINLLMVQDDTCYPGYCRLQVIRPDVPLPCEYLVDIVEGLMDHMVNDEKNRMVLKNNYIDLFRIPGEKHGPAFTSTVRGNLGTLDMVFAFPCKTWPKGFKRFTPNVRLKKWPTPEMIQHILKSGCFVVPVSHRLDLRPDLTWRISTSRAERCLMFSLNITQIRCYVLLKMIAKTFIEPYMPDVISSYMCKTLLFHSIETTHLDFWREDNLLSCVHHVLLRMYQVILHDNCPNYFNESANLFLGRIDHEIRDSLQSKIEYLLKNNGRFLSQIKFDRFNNRMEVYITQKSLYSYQIRTETRNLFLNSLRLTGLTQPIITLMQRRGTNPFTCLKTLANYEPTGRLDREATQLFCKFFASSIASAETSCRIAERKEISVTSLMLYNLSLDSDAASSRLKYASYLYSTDQLKTAVFVLEDVKTRLSGPALPYCGCSGKASQTWKLEFAENERRKKFPSLFNIGMCVMFSPEEINCCPAELRYELYRLNSHNSLAVLDCLSFLHLLQYLAFKKMNQNPEKNLALTKLTELVFGEYEHDHIDTACNILGQCMELEKRLDLALYCYKMSFQIRPENNACRWIIGRLLYKQYIHALSGHL